MTVAPSDFALTSPIESVPGVGPQKGKAFRALGIPSIAHLVHYLPFRHEREEAEETIDQIVPGQKVAARGEVTATRVAGRGRRGRFEAVLMDETGRLDLVWFNQAYLHKRIHPGMRLLVQGEARRRGAYIQVANAEWKALDEDGVEPARRGAAIRPVYHASEALPSAEIARAINAVLDHALPQIEDHLPESFRAERDFPSLAESYRMMHRPTDEREISRARRRLAYDELFFLQLAILRLRVERSGLAAPALPWSESIDTRIRARIPFQLTEGQDEAVRDIATDLQRDHPANRLIQGDVGSGKTVVALYAMLMAVAGGKQAAMMAPTELLAEQHYDSISRLLEGSKVRVELLTASLPTPDRERIESDIASGAVAIVIGTHALLTESVTFDDLAVAIIDEQHRFGVHQRTGLRGKAEGSSPHVLVMTATPIPRSLTQTFFGDLDISTIRGLPPGRGVIETHVRTPADRAEIDATIVERIEQGEQAYVVLPAIESGNKLRDVRSTVERLESGPLAGRRIAAVHGKLKRDTRRRIMEQFRLGKIDALVATTVIEVGVDVPNASLMVIEHADRFGLAQLHQLRGRIGRGANDALCILVAEPVTPDGSMRIDAIATTTDGFELAEKDLEIRGPGDLAGVRQSGAPALRVADLMGDMKLLALARRDAIAWLKRSPQLDQPDDALLARRLAKMFREQGD